MPYVDFDNVFTYHPPQEGQPERFQEIRDAGRDLAEIVLAECPSSPERSLAFTKIREAIMWANAAIAVNE
jgi:hypothetical protein